VLIDCPPALDLLTVNSLVAADSVLIPIQCEFFALEGISQLLDTIDRLRESLQPALAIEGILLTMFDERTNLARQVAADLRDFFQGEVFQRSFHEASASPKHRALASRSSLTIPAPRGRKLYSTCQGDRRQ